MTRPDRCSGDSLACRFANHPRGGDRTTPAAGLARLPLRGNWLLVAAVVWTLVEAFILARSWLRPELHSVYPIFDLAGQHWREGSKLYFVGAPGIDIFRYSPLVAGLFAPMSLVPIGPAGVLWRLLNLAIYLGGLWWWVRAILPQPLTANERGIVLLLLLPLSLLSLNNGQANPLMLGLMLASVAAVRHRRFGLAGAALALAFWLKLYPIALGLLLVSLYRRRFLMPFLAGLAAGFALPFLMQAPDYVLGEYRHWFEYLIADNRDREELHLLPKDARLLLLLCGIPLSQAKFAVVQVVTGAAVAVCCWLWQRRGVSEPVLLLRTTALSCCWMTTFGPSTEPATYILLAPVLALPLLRAWQQSGLASQRIVLTLCYCLIPLHHATRTYPLSEWPTLTGLQPLAGLMLFAYLIVTGFIGGDPCDLTATPADEASPAAPAVAA